MSKKQESKSYAELEADLFLAERAFKRVPSDENEVALKVVKKAFEALQTVKEEIKAVKPATATKPAAKAPAATKPAPSKPAVKQATEPAQTETEDSKKN